MSAVTSVAHKFTKCNLARNRSITTNKTIKLMRIPSYIGIPVDELADELATKVVRTPYTRKYPHSIYEDVIHSLKIKCQSLWQLQRGK